MGQAGITTLISGSLSAAASLLCKSWWDLMLCAVLGPWLLQLSLLLTIRTVEEEALQMSEDVRAERANGTLVIYSLGATVVCLTLLVVSVPISFVSGSGSS